MNPSKELLRIAYSLLSEDEDDDRIPGKYEYPAHPSKDVDPLEMDKDYTREHRPHGWEIRKPTDIKIKAHGNMTAQKFASWLSRNGFSQHDYSHDVLPKYKFISYIVTNTSSKLNYQAAWYRKQVEFISGWDSSYHDAQWLGQALIYAFADTVEEAERLVHSAFKDMVPDEDPIKKRFELRRLVRPGD